MSNRDIEAAWIATPAPGDLPAEVAEEIGDVSKQIGFLPNVARLLAVTPDHFVRWWRYFDELMRDPRGSARPSAR